MPMFEELSVLEQAQSYYSDFFKEVNGFRPRGILMPTTLEDVEEAIACLHGESESELRAIKEYEDFLREERRKADRAYKKADNRFAALLKLKG